MGSNLDRILTQVVETGDNYALQAYISELERSGAIDNLVEALEEHREQGSAGSILLQALTNCREKIEEAGKVSAATAGAS
jgi:hypothetical protein